MSSDATATRRRLRVEELCGASIRALSGHPELRYRGGRLLHGQSIVPGGASHLRPNADDDFASFRGAADGIALRIVHSDLVLHQALSPVDELPNVVFEMLEQFRVESLVDPGLSGAIANLRHTHVTWSGRFQASGITETEQGMLLYTVAQICRSKVTGEPVVEATEDLLEHTRFMLSPIIGTELAGLRRQRHNQSAYAELALAIATKVSDLVVAETDTASTSASKARPRNLFSLTISDTEGELLEAPVATSGQSPAFDAANRDYRVFTREYDRELPMSRVVRQAQLKEYRQRLDEQVARSGINVRWLGRQLRHVLAEPDRYGWDAAQEEGVIDGRSLTRLITAPTDHRLFRRERIEPVSDCVVSIVLDCSGSMRRHHESIATVVDILARALDLADITSEILAFTTGAWNGGRAMRDWKRSGQPPHPGRLNEQFHIVLKDADTPWSKARPGIAGLLRQDIYREAIDGEAVAWACRRLDQRTEARKLLVVVSDGSPMDGATNLTNDAHYLGAHLRDVVATREAMGSIAITGLGVGLDLSPYYSHSHVLDLGEGINARVFGEIVDLMARAKRTHP